MWDVKLTCYHKQRVCDLTVRMNHLVQWFSNGVAGHASVPLGSEKTLANRYLILQAILDLKLVLNLLIRATFNHVNQFFYPFCH